MSDSRVPKAGGSVKAKPPSFTLSLVLRASSRELRNGTINASSAANLEGEYVYRRGTNLTACVTIFRVTAKTYDITNGDRAASLSFPGERTWRKSNGFERR